MSNGAGWTKIHDNVAQELGAMPALVFGVILRHQKMADGVCRASHETLAKKIGTSARTIARQIDELIASGYITKSGVAGAVIEYKVTKAAEQFAEGESKEKPQPMTNCHKLKTQQIEQPMTNCPSTYDKLSEQPMTNCHIKSIKSIKSIKPLQTANAVSEFDEQATPQQNEQSKQDTQQQQAQSEQEEQSKSKNLTHQFNDDENANLKPQSKNHNDNSDCQFAVAPPAPAALPAAPVVAPAAEPTQKAKKQREPSEHQKAMTRLNAVFAEVRGVELPSWSGAKAAKAANVNWNAAHAELLANVGGDVEFAERVIRQVVGEYVRSSDSLNNRYPMIEPRSFRARYIQEAAAEKRRASVGTQPVTVPQSQPDERIPVTRLFAPAFINAD